MSSMTIYDFITEPLDTAPSLLKNADSNTDSTPKEFSVIMSLCKFSRLLEKLEDDGGCSAILTMLTLL